MFGGNAYSPPRMLSYDEALGTWESIKPVRGRDDTNTKPLAHRRNDRLTIRKANDDVVVRFHDTDIVTYHPDGTITVSPYASVTTCRVMRDILYPELNPHWKSRHFNIPTFVTEIGGRYFNTPSMFVVDTTKPLWEPVAGYKPFSVPQLNRSKARRALNESGYFDFKVWLETQIKLGVDPRRRSPWRAPLYGKNQYRLLIARQRGGNEGWSKLANQYAVLSSLDTAYARLRHSVYKHAGCIEAKEVPYFDSYGELELAMNSMRKYG